jgi:hypothetical protein
MTKDYIDVYESYAIKLLRLQNDMIQTFYGSLSSPRKYAHFYIAMLAQAPET